MDNRFLRRLILGFILALSLAITYVVFGSLILTLWDSWKNDPFYQHGIFVAGLSVLLVILSVAKNPKVFHFTVQDQKVSFAFFVLAALFFLSGLKTHMLFLGGLSFSFWMISLSVLLFSVSNWKSAVSPWLYFLTAVPLPYLNEFSGLLQIWVAKVTYTVFHWFSYPISFEGLTIKLPEATLLIAADCTGIKSWLVLFSLIVFFLYFIRLSLWKKISIAIFIFPIAMLSNLFRVWVLTGIAFYYGEKMAMTYWHDYAGAVFYGLSCVLVLICVKGTRYRA